MRRSIQSLSLLLLLVPVFGDSLSLDAALSMALNRNGLIAAAGKNVESAKSVVRGSWAEFFPTVTPTYSWFDQRENQSLGSITKLSFDSTALVANWLLLDGGQRSFALSRNKNLAESTKHSATWTVRQVLFATTRQFYEALKARELLKVADAQVARTRELVEAVQRRIDVGAAAKKDILQPQADLANAIVDQITARNAVSTGEASLKASLGWPTDEPLDVLEVPAEPLGPPPAESLSDAIAFGVMSRPDLQDSRSRIKADKFSVMTAKRNASLDWRLNLAYDRGLDPEDNFNRTFTFMLSYPLFDAGRTREVVRQTRLNLEANQLLLDQDVRDAKSEIESVFLTWEQNKERLAASELALKASQVNFAAVSDAYPEAATILEVSNARVALVTAETNYIRARFDYIISDAQLNLVVGKPMRGEAR